MKKKDLKKCIKCKEPVENGALYIYNAGKLRTFCKTCADILDTFPNPADMIDTFLESENEMSPITKNIFEARKKRLKGNPSWSKIA